MDIARFGALSLNDSSGHPHRLADLWAASPTVFVFLRHFG
jgi:hypothetical protein